MARSSVNISRIVRFFFYFSCLCFFIRSLPPLVATVHASPVSVVGRQPFDFNSPAWQAILEKVNLRPGEIVIGWRYVSSFKARDYDKFGTLTAIRASRTSIGEGAYFSPDPQAEFKQLVSSVPFAGLLI
ncbi:hypothetical protein GYMLUDRAFT_711657 [Collybiopsis luxurians FD-317 M1]|nr:hypothetical protein GYMLUDRAFT_711657 [Collybiopsis luxurians FD-317 M1]